MSIYTQLDASPDRRSENGKTRDSRAERMERFEGRRPAQENGADGRAIPAMYRKPTRKY